ncbi:MAG: helix-turn-helix transcriptional regulator [Oscillospiraceae bacterium]
MEDKLYTSIAKNIKKYRTLNNMTQETLSRLLWIDAQYYSQLETGRRKFSIATIVKCCEIFGCSVNDIIVVADNEEFCNEEMSEKVDLLAEKIKACSPQKILIIEKIVSELIEYL